MSIKRTRAAKARSRNHGRDDSWARAGAEGSLAHRLSESPGGIEGALARLQAATATGRPMTALEKFAAAIGEEPGTEQASQPRSDDPATWPIVWRVVSPAAGSYDHDLVYLETESEAEARDRYAVVCEAKLPARLERVSCGPLPKKAVADIRVLRKGNAQNPGAKMPGILGHWEARS